MFLNFPRLCGKIVDPETKRGRRGSVDFRKDVEPRRPEMQFIRKLIKSSKGATAIEYGLIAALIAVAAITAMQGLGTSLKSTFNNVSSAMK
jgi:pilus assembly protein Flp/PilA